jgi:hypothetical protein
VSVQAAPKVVGARYRRERPLITRIRPSLHAMTIRVANTDFDRVDYDADGNVLYLAAGDPERVVGL